MPVPGRGEQVVSRLGAEDGLGVADPAAPLIEYTERVARLVKIAHDRGVAAEAEVGELPHGDDPGAARSIAAGPG